jgi:MYXO-CTERM domain-containing protein
MKKALALSAGLALIAAAPALADFPGQGPGGSIPDNNATGFSSTIVLAGAGTITDLNVNIGGLRHSWIGDLRMTLTHVDTATSVTFVDRPGTAIDGTTSTVGDSSNYGLSPTVGANYTFDDEGADLWANIMPAANGTSYQLPAGNWSHVNAGDLSGFDGQPIAGTWILTISDHAGADTGLFANWDIKATTSVPAPGALALLGLAGLAGTRRRRG